MAQHFHIEAPIYISDTYRFEPTMTRATRAASSKKKSHSQCVAVKKSAM